MLDYSYIISNKIKNDYELKIIMKGDLKLIIGPMFSGKTTELINRYSRYIIAKKQCIMVKYDKDNRYSFDNVVTHNNIKVSAISCNFLNNLEIPAETQIICIDEIQFYTDAYDFCANMINRGITVICAGLNGTFSRHPFQVLTQLMPLATDIIFCKGICDFCQSENACYSKRISEETEDLVIGGSDKYKACCKDCF